MSYFPTSNSATAIVLSQTLLVLPSNLTNKPPSSAPPAETVEALQHADTRLRMTPDPAAIDVTPPTPGTAIMPSQTLASSLINEPPSSAPPTETVEALRHVETIDQV